MKTCRYRVSHYKHKTVTEVFKAPDPLLSYQVVRFVKSYYLSKTLLVFVNKNVPCMAINKSGNFFPQALQYSYFTDTNHAIIFNKHYMVFLFYWSCLSTNHTNIRKHKKQSIKPYNRIKKLSNYTKMIYTCIYQINLYQMWNKKLFVGRILWSIFYIYKNDFLYIYCPSLFREGFKCLSISLGLAFW